MNNIQRLELELRQVENEIVSFDLDVGTNVELSKLGTKRIALSEQLEVAKSQDAGHRTETREADPRWQELSAEFRMSDVVDAVLNGHRVDGATAEYQQELNLNDNEISVRQLMDRNDIEMRAVTPAPANVQGNAQPVVGYVFPASAHQFLAIPTPVVRAGESIYPVLTSELTVSAPAENATVAETTGSFTAEKLSPARLQASFFYSREDRAMFAGMEDALRTNLRLGLMDGLDDSILTGTNGLFTGTNLTDHDAATAYTYATYLSNLAYGRVDGRYAGTLGDLRILMGAAVYADAGSTLATSTDVSAAEKLTALTNGLRVSAHVPDIASEKQDTIIRLGTRQDAVAPIWENVALIDDQITKAALGQITLTAVMLYNFKVLRTDGFYKQEVQVA